MEHYGNRDTNLIGALRMIPKSLVREELEKGGRTEAIQTVALLRSARILRRVKKTCCHSESSDRPSANAGMKNSGGGGVMMMMMCYNSRDVKKKNIVRMRFIEVGIILQKK